MKRHNDGDWMLYSGLEGDERLKTSSSICDDNTVVWQKKYFCLWAYADKTSIEV